MKNKQDTDRMNKNERQKKACQTEQLPLNKSIEKLQNGIILRHITEDKEFALFPHAHRDDYYLFFFQESGISSAFIDFEEYRMEGKAMGCIIPGQVHIAGMAEQARGWFLAVDGSLIADEYRNTFENLSSGQASFILSDEVVQDLTACFSILHRRLKDAVPGSPKNILHALTTACIGMFSENLLCYKDTAPDNRYTLITKQFKTLLMANFRSLKRPQEYASLLNISAVYLNEAVKHTMGISVSEYIQKEIILEAKRMLYYTDKSIKEIAFALGYEDCAYFSRLFTKVAGMNPSAHRKKYHE